MITSCDDKLLRVERAESSAGNAEMAQSPGIKLNHVYRYDVLATGQHIHACHCSRLSAH